MILSCKNESENMLFKADQRAAAREKAYNMLQRYIKLVMVCHNSLERPVASPRTSQIHQHDSSALQHFSLLDVVRCCEMVVFFRWARSL